MWKQEGFSPFLIATRGLVERQRGCVPHPLCVEDVAFVGWRFQRGFGLEKTENGTKRLYYRYVCSLL